MIEQADVAAVRRSVVVRVPPERAFSVFTRDLGTWWPLENYAVGAQPATTAVIEPREGGRWYERAADGSECDWGRVLAYEPPTRLVLSWDISADWRPDPSARSEVEVRFVEQDGGTRVELEHRRLEVYGEQAAQLRAALDSPDGWRGLLERFASATA